MSNLSWYASSLERAVAVRRNIFHRTLRHFCISSGSVSEDEGEDAVARKWRAKLWIDSRMSSLSCSVKILFSGREKSKLERISWRNCVLWSALDRRGGVEVVIVDNVGLCSSIEKWLGADKMLSCGFKENRQRREREEERKIVALLKISQGRRTEQGFKRQLTYCEDVKVQIFKIGFL